MGATPPSWSSLAGNLAVIVGGVLLMNGLIFGLGWGDGGGAPAPAPARPGAGPDVPGWVVGLVWTVLFALMAVARWRMAGPEQAAERGWITALILFCLAFPLYALAPRSMLAAFVGCLATIALAGVVVWRVQARSRPAALCVAPVIAWLLFDSATILADWGWLGPRS